MRSFLMMLSLLLSIVPSVARADRILKVDAQRRLLAIELEDPESFSIDDGVCVSYNDFKVACGEIFQIAGKGAIVFITRGEVNIPKTAQVTLTKELAVPISRNLSLGVNYLFPQVSFQQLFAEKWTYGILCEALIAKSGPKILKGIASLLTLNYYGGGTFRGLWLSAGVGVHLVNVQPNDDESLRSSVTSLVFQGNVGWRVRFNRSVNFGLAVGGMYFIDPSLHPYTMLSGLNPSVIAELGYSF